MSEQDEAAKIKEDLQKRLKRISEGDMPEQAGITVHKVSMIEVSNKELQAAVKANPDHPVAKALKPMLYRFPDQYKHVMETADLQGLLENKEVITDIDHIELDNMRSPVRSKHVGDEAPKQDAEVAQSSSATFDTAAAAVMTPPQAAKYPPEVLKDGGKNKEELKKEGN